MDAYTLTWMLLEGVEINTTTAKAAETFIEIFVFDPAHVRLDRLNVTN